jgi:large subunit ribosomal protein L25
MEEVVLKAKHRDLIGKQVKALRRQGEVPAVLYGRIIQPLPVVLNAREANRIIPGVTSSQLVQIDLDGERHIALVREKQFNAILGSLLHIDFNVVSMTEKLRTTVSLFLEGESLAVKNFDGILVAALEELEVECLPKFLPERIVVDISSLVEIGDTIHVRDIHLPDEIEVLTDLDEVVAVVTAPELEEEAIAAGPVEPEVIEKGKKEEEDF